MSAPLDVERLTRALDVAMVPRPGGTSIRDLAKAVAVEYAALQPVQETPDLSSAAGRPLNPDQVRLGPNRVQEDAR